jgi:hypothetical protein
MIMCLSGATCLHMECCFRIMIMLSEWSDMSTHGVLFQNHDNVSEWSDMSTHGVLFQNHDNVSEWSDMFTHGVLFQ